ncbi:MAG: thiamine phosphate synthase [Thermoanaerobaculia bacterium]
MRLLRAAVPPLYALTPTGAGRDAADVVAELVSAGVRWIQLREKNRPDDQLFEIARSIATTLPARVAFFVNDRTDIALATGADGVHLGEFDIPPSIARSVAGERLLIIGRSTHSEDEAIAVASDPDVDYVAIGPIFISNTKNVRPPLGLEAIRRIRATTAKPVVAIGGIDASNIRSVLDAGADSCAVVSALYAEEGSVHVNAHRILDAAGVSR